MPSASSVGRLPLPAPLQLPADAIADSGEITLTGGRAAMVAATTVNLALRTADEQAALIEVFGRWLNSLSTPTQIVVSAQPVDLHSHADHLTQAADALPHPALADLLVHHLVAETRPGVARRLGVHGDRDREHEREGRRQQATSRQERRRPHRAPSRW